jgi:ABC-type multidrug transport system ATPase subunit
VQQEAGSWLQPRGFKTDIAAEVFYLENPGTVLAVISVALQPSGCACGGSPGCEMSYIIMINGSYLVGSSSKGWAEYRSISAGFVTVQNAVDEALLQLYARNATTMRLRLQTTTQEYTVGLSFIGSSSIFGGLCLILSFIPNVHFLIMNIAEERRTAAHHELRCGGLLVSAFWASWLSWTLIMNGCVTVFVVSVSSFFGLFKGSNLPLCLLLFILYLSSCSTFAFFISSFFDRPQLAGAVGTSLYGLISCLYFLMRILDAKANVINWLFFLPPVAMGPVTESIWNGEARWNHLMSGSFPIVYSACALAGGCLFYFVGVCWNSRIVSKKALEKSSSEDVELHSVEDGRRLAAQGVQLRHVYGERSGRAMLIPFVAHHQYSRLGSTVAIDGVDIDLFCGEILIIFGPNGAGKSTLLSILSGRIFPTSGQVSIYNGASVGYCPQSDLLVCWPQLTGLQHLQIYARVKLSSHLAHVSTSSIETCVNDALQLVQISEVDANRPVLEYSGGLRRLLSVAVALLDSPQILILDEPFSSISPSECSVLINSIRGFSSRGGSVIMATHNFNDVEELADRIAVFGDGCLKAIGTPRYFKQRFGAGFELRCDTELSDSGLLASHAHAVLEIVCSHVPESSIRSLAGSTMIFNIPATREGLVHDSDTAQPLSILLSSLQASSHQLSITSCFISSVTLEQIFTSISHSGDAGKIDVAPDNTAFSDPLLLVPMSAAALHWNQFKAISLKKVLVIRRDTRLMVYALVYPLLLFGAVIAMSYVDLPGFEAQAPLPFDITMRDAIDNWRKFPVAVAAGSDTEPLLTNMPLTHALQSACPVRQCFESRVFGKFSDLYAYLRAQVILKEIRDDPAQLKKIQPDQEAAIQMSQADGLSYFGGLRINSFYLNANEMSCDAVLVFNNSAEHSASYVQSLLSNSFLSIIKNANKRSNSSTDDAPSVSSDIKTSIVTRSRPLPFKYKFVDVGALVQALGCLLIFTWSVPLITEIIVRERQARIFQQLKLLGLPPSILWLSYLIVDSVFVSVPIIITLLVGRVTNKGSFSVNYFPATAVLCIFYAPAMASFAHVSSFAFAKPDVVLKYLTIMIFVSAGSLFGTLAALSISDPGLADFVEWVLGFYPPCALAWGIFQLASRSAFDSQAAVTNLTQLILPKLIQLSLSSVMLTACCIVLDTFWLHLLSDDTPQSSRPTQRPETPREDADVRRERARVSSMLRNELHSPRCIIANQLSKVYGDVVTGIPALYELSFVSQAGEITCIVGPSGCGKSTIVSILAGACRATGGTADFRDKLNVPLQGSCSRVGVVFQSDTVWDELTPREYLSLSFCISGLPNALSIDKVSQAIAIFGLETFADTPARALSLGCRRKMCVAAVLLGQLPFLIFDEPLVGFDANSKQNFWTLLDKVFNSCFGIRYSIVASDTFAQTKNSSAAPAIFMTTHSIDEAATVVSFSAFAFLHCAASLNNSPGVVKTRHIGRGPPEMHRIPCAPAQALQSARDRHCAMRQCCRP